MGDDFSCHQCFAGNNPDDIRKRLIEAIKLFFTDNHYQLIDREDEADRSFVIGPAERWIFIGDSAGSTDTVDPAAFQELSIALSKIASIVDIKMSDSAAVHFYLYQQGEIVDKFGNGAFHFFKFKTEEEAREFQGQPEQWAKYLVNSADITRLREVWVQDWKADQILYDCTELFGWNPHIYYVGYTFDNEGLGEKYDEFLASEFDEGKLNRSDFLELHFQKR